MKQLCILKTCSVLGEAKLEKLQARKQTILDGA